MQLMIQIFRIINTHDPNIRNFPFQSTRDPYKPAAIPESPFGQAPMNRFIRSVELIDRNLASLAPLFDEMRDRLRDDHGVTKARYSHAVPLADGARLAVSASPPIRALAEDYVRNRRYELDLALLPKMREAEPSRWIDAPDDADCPRAMVAARHAWRALVRRIIGDNWRHGFDVPVYGPGGRRGLFKINPPLEQPLSESYMRGVRHVLLDFHLAYCAVQLASAPKIMLAPGDQEALAGAAAGLKAEAIGYELGITGRAVEERLARARRALRCRTTVEAAAKGVTQGLLL
jgi:hypothetical protein